MTQATIGTLQLKKVHHLFRVFDFDQNGFIEGKDFTSHAHALSTARGIPLDSPQRHEFVALMNGWWDQIRHNADTNADGRVGPTEFVQFWTGMLAAAADGVPGALEGIKGSAAATFDVIDANRDGHISAGEMGDWLAAWNVKTDVPALFARFDHDGDGRLVRDDVVRLVKEFFLTNDPEAAGNDLYGPLS